MACSRRRYVFRAIAGLTLAATGRGAASPMRASMTGAGPGHAASKARVLREMPEVGFLGGCLPDERASLRGEEFVYVPRLTRSAILNETSIDLAALEGEDPA